MDARSPEIEPILTNAPRVSFKDGISNYTSFWIRPFAKAYGKKMTEDAENFGQVLQKMFAEINEKCTDILLFELTCDVSLDESGLSDSTVSDEHDLELSSLLLLVASLHQLLIKSNIL